MRSRRIETRHPDLSGCARNLMSAARAVSPYSAPDGFGRFSFADTRYQCQLSDVRRGRSESCVAVEQSSAEGMRTLRLLQGQA